MPEATETNEAPLYRDRRIMALVVIAILAILWAIFAHNSAGNQRERSAALEERLVTLESEHAMLQQDLEERNQAGEEIETLQAQVASLDEERLSMEATLAEERQARKDEVERLKDEAATESERLQGLQEERATLEQDVEAARSDHAELEEQMAALREELDSANQARSEAEAAVEASQAELQELESARQQADEQRQQAEAEREQAGMQLEELRSETAAAEERFATLNTALDERQATLEAVEAVEASQGELKKRESPGKKADDNRRQEEAEREQAGMKLEELRSEPAAAEERFATLNPALDERQAPLEAVESDIEAWNPGA